MRMLIVAGLFVSALAAAPARAETLQAPEGGRPIPLGKDRVVCGGLSGGWIATPDRKNVRPPASASSASVEVTVASDLADCSRSKVSLSLIATRTWPDFDTASIVFFPEEGRLELKGRNLEGVQFAWQAGTRSGQQTCLGSLHDGRGEECTIPLDRKLPTNTVFHWLPAYAKDGSDVTTFDDLGRPAPDTTFRLYPARFVLGKIFAPVETLDISQGLGTLPVLHPDAIASVECGLARCELGDGGIVVRGVPAQATQVAVTVRLSPRFSISRGEKTDNSASATFPVSRCPLSVASGPPLRDADHPQILVKMLDRCRSSARLRWFVDAEPAEVVREVHGDDGDYVLLSTIGLSSASASITVARADTSAGVFGSVTTSTMRAPRPQSTLELPGHGRIEFIPTNRDALWSVGGIPHARFVPLELPGVYAVHTEKDRTLIRGDRNTSGFTSLRYAYRGSDMPKGFEDVNLAIITESIQRPLHEASVPVPFGTTPTRKEPLAEFLCANKSGAVEALPPGKPLRIPFSARETCRVVIHQDRLRPEDGEQEIVLDIDVTKAGGGKRSEASLSEHMVLHPGGEQRVFFLKGVTEQFDQVTVRLSHVVDESRYVLDVRGKQEPPSEQWTATVEGGRLRLYVSLNVPAGLYRINAPAASLTLNFGVLGRLTWLNREGKEGLLGLETGVLGASLIPQQYNNSPAFPPTLVTLLGVGLRVDIGQGAAVGVHLWGAYEFRSEYFYGDDNRRASHWSLLFGPSISIGNVGTNL
jgi:hypothetical protein